MSQNVNQAVIEYYDDAVKTVYQGEGNQLVNCTQQRNNITGSTARFTVYGKGASAPRIYRSPVQPMSPAVTTPTATLTDWVAADYSDIFEQQKINFDEINVLTRVAGMAIGRTHDQLIIDDGLVASGTTNIVPDGGDNLTFEKVLQINQYFNSIGVPKRDRFIAISAEAEASLLESERLTSKFFVNNMLLQDGSIDGQMLMGLKFIVIPTTVVDGQTFGLPKIGDIRSCYAWHRDAVGFAVGISQQTQINYVPQMLSWLTATILSAGAVAIDATGIIEIQCDEAA
jgi:hypothetical protein